MSDNDKPKFDLRSLADAIVAKLEGARRYSFVIFIVIVALLYSFLVLRINSLSSSQPTADAVSKQVKAARVPHIDQSVIDQLQSLQDNNVSVKSLFDSARSNPFQ